MFAVTYLVEIAGKKNELQPRRAGEKVTDFVASGL